MAEEKETPIPKTQRLAVLTQPDPSDHRIGFMYSADLESNQGEEFKAFLTAFEKKYEYPYLEDGFVLTSILSLSDAKPNSMANESKGTLVGSLLGKFSSMCSIARSAQKCNWPEHPIMNQEECMQATETFLQKTGNTTFKEWEREEWSDLYQVKLLDNAKALTDYHTMMNAPTIFER